MGLRLQGLRGIGDDKGFCALGLLIGSGDKGFGVSSLDIGD